MAYISKGFTLEFNQANPYDGSIMSYWTQRAQEEGSEIGEKYILPGLQEIGDLAMTSAGAGEYDKIEVTTLADNKHMYVDGLMADSSSSGNTIDFKFLYEPKLFNALAGTMRLEEAGGREGFNKWTIDVPGDKAGQFTVTANIASVKMDTVSVNSAITFVLTLNVRGIEFSTTI